MLGIYYENKITTLVLGPGDVLVFGPEFWHRGAAYTHANFRLHSYARVFNRDTAPISTIDNTTERTNLPKELKTLLQEEQRAELLKK